MGEVLSVDIEASNGDLEKRFLSMIQNLMARMDEGLSNLENSVKTPSLGASLKYGSHSSNQVMISMI